MEIIVTIAYFFLVRLVFFDYKLIRFNLFWKFVVFGLYTAAAMTEVIMLGQYDPYSKAMVVEAYVVQMAPEFGGVVKEVYVVANKPVKKGDPLFEMDPAQWIQKLDQAKAEYNVARDEYRRLKRAGTGAVSQEQIVSARNSMVAAQSQVGEAQYNVDHTTIVAPADGYPVNVQLRPGAFIRLKVPVMDFVVTEEYRLVATVNQRAARWVDSGDEVEVALSLYPGRVFPAVVDSVIWARGKAQLSASGQLPSAASFASGEAGELFAVRIRLAKEDPAYPLRFGAIGLAAIYTGEGPSVFRLLRELEIRSESWLNYVYNPF